MVGRDHSLSAHNGHQGAKADELRSQTPCALSVVARSEVSTAEVGMRAARANFGGKWLSGLERKSGWCS